MDNERVGLGPSPVNEVSVDNTKYVDNGSILTSSSQNEKKILTEETSVVLQPEEESKSDKKKNKKTKPPAIPIYKLFRFATKLELLLILIASIFSIGVGALQPLSIIVMGQFLGKFGEAMTGNPVDILANSIQTLVMTLVYFGIASTIAGYVSNCLWVLTGENQVRRIRTRYMHSILRQDMGWFDKAEDGSLNTRLAADTQLIQDGISEKFGMFLMCISQFISGLIVAFIKGWQLAVIILATVPLLSGAGAAMGISIGKFTLKAQNSYAEAGSIAEQAFSGIRTVYSFSLQNRFVGLYEKKLDNAMKSGITRGKVTGFGVGTFLFVLFSTYGLSFWYGSKLSAEGKMTGADVYVVFFAMMLGSTSLSQLPDNLSAVSGACGAAYKIFGTIDRVPFIDIDRQDGYKPEKIQGEIQFKNVKFSYPTRPDTVILKDFSLDVKPGTTVAFVGPSGSGKSTGIQLLQRFYDPLEGEVLLDGKDLKDYNLAYLRSQIGVVSQEPVLFNMTIKQNLLMGVTKEVSNDEIVAACKKANCHTFISMLPDKYETLVGEFGGMISGGQKQRIAIARAILKNPAILLLDEATSALDTQSERLVQAALEAASADRTTIVIAHRLSTIRNADMIVVVKDGQLVEKGTHDELVAHDGVYASLVKKQEIMTQQVGSKPEEIDHEELLRREEEELAAERKRLDEADELGSDEKGLFRTNSHASVDAFKLKLEKEKEERKKIRKQKAPLGKVLRDMRPEWPLLMMGTVGSAIAGAVYPAFTLVFAQVVSRLINPNAEPSGPMSGNNLYAFLFAVIGVASFIGVTIQTINFEKAGERYTKRLRSAIFRSYMKQEIGFYDDERNTLGSITSKLAIDAKNVNEMITKTWGSITQISISVTAGLAIAFSQSWALTLIILCMSPFIVISFSYQFKANTGFEDAVKEANTKSGRVAGEAIKEIRTVAGLNKQCYFEDKFFETTSLPHKLAKRQAYISSVGYALQRGIIIFTSALAFYAGTKLILNNGLNFNKMFTCMMAIVFTAQNIGQTSGFTATFAKAKYSAIGAFEILERQPSIDPDLEGIEPDNAQIEGRVNFKEVAFSYPARPDIPIFSGKFDLNGKAGTTIALVGPSGCGKSTTIGMLQRWYDATAGSVNLDDNNVKKYTVGNLRSHMGLVGQEPVLFDMSIGDNIRFGIDESKEVSQEEVESACKAANIHKFISELPDGYDTRVGDKGSQLSGGQKQRIAIARALIRKPKLLLLDEATSALDSESEKLVQAAIDNILEEGGRTTITIAHRLSTIQNADLICVVKDGQVIEQGTHWELLKLNGTYSDLVYQQSLAAN